MRLLVFLVGTAACGARSSLPVDDFPITDGSASDRSADGRTIVDAGFDASHPTCTPGPNPFRPGDHWMGSYTCQQGLTKLDLQIVSTNGDQITDALFVFDWNQKHGSFHITGTFVSRACTATFVPGEWVVRPGDEWYAVGMDGTVTLGTMTYTGQIVASSCGGFSVVQQ